MEPVETQSTLFTALQSEGPADLARERAASRRSGSDLVAELTRLFGFPTFRPGQREAVEAVLAGRDALAVMPTGGGKSLTYMLPAFLQEGLTLVVSPLISLMQDQVTKLADQGLPASLLNSHVPYGKQRETLDDLRAGRLRLLFVAPERFRNARFLQALEGASLDLFAVDEAHCISRWGHDFRPDYMRLGEAAERCGRPPVLAVTATATAEVRRDIVRQLGLRDPLTLVRGFDRPNLFLASEVVHGGRLEKLRVLLGYLRQAPPGPGIVYCATRKNTDNLARDLRRLEFGRVGVYHAGLSQEVRRRTQERFFSGGLDVVVATNAFGLGIDKHDLRFVLHHDLPGSLEAYYQEAGRAGRDGEPAVCALLFAPQDIYLQKFFIETSHPKQSLVEEVARAVHRIGSDPDRIAGELTEHANGRAIESALRLLEGAKNDVRAIDFAAVRRRARHEQRLLEQLITYARGGGCRRAEILHYFGAPDVPSRCEACDRCRRPPGATRPKRSQTRPSGVRKKKQQKKKKKGEKRTTKEGEPTPAFVPKTIDDAQLMSRLRQLRSKIARCGRIPAYRVFHDKTLLALVASRPASREELLEIHGLGERKVSRYGEQLLELIADSHK